jgi:hemin uptake protein HemP
VDVALSDSNKAQPAAVNEDAVRSVKINNGEIDSLELFQSQRELLIRHGEDVYRLRRTGLNKLILTK